MPTYEYQCGQCGQVFDELIFTPAEEEALKCPVCGAGKPNRRVTACAGVASSGHAGPACDAGFG